MVDEVSYIAAVDLELTSSRPSKLVGFCPRHAAIKEIWCAWCFNGSL
jgi:hypothetical protein